MKLDVDFTKVADGDHVTWQYKPLREGDFRDITSTTKLYVVRDITSVTTDPSTNKEVYTYGSWRKGTASELETGKYTKEKNNLEIVEFEFSGTNNEDLTIKNPRIPLSGMGLKAIAVPGTAGLSPDPTNGTIGPVALTVLKADYESFDIRVLNQFMNIGTEVDPFNSQQFAVFLKYNDGQGQKLLYNDRRIRFLNVPAGATLDEVNANIKHEVAESELTSTPALNAKGVYTASVADGKTAYKNGDKWYVCNYDLGTEKEPGTDTRGTGENGFSKKVASGDQVMYVVLPDFENPTLSLVSTVTISGVDLEAPTMTEIKADWVAKGVQPDWSDATVVEPYTFGSGVVKGSNFSMRLLVEDIKDNVAKFNETDAEHPITLQWRKDGRDIEGANGNILYIAGDEGDPRGFYELVAYDDAYPQNSSSVSFNLSSAWDNEAPEFDLLIDPPTSEPSSYRTVTINVHDTDENPANLADKAFAFVGPVDPSDTAFDVERLLTEAGKDDANWSIANSYTITENGDYYVYVRDKAGNVRLWTDDGTGSGSAALSINDIDRDTPAIQGTDVEPSVDENGSPNTDPATGEQYIRIIVHAEDGTNGGQLWYKLEKEGVTVIDWTTDNVFDNLKEGGSYVVYVKDSAGNISRYVINNIDKDTVLGKISGNDQLTQLFGVYVRCSNSRYWTNEDIVITLDGGNEQILDPVAPFSYNGGPWTSDRQYVMTDNGTFTLSVKDIYGHEYPYTNIQIECIDKVAPTFTATPSAKNNTITINASDDPDGASGSGLDQLYYFYNGVKHSVMAFNENTHVSGPQTIMVEELGTYDIWVQDKAGNRFHNSIDITSVSTDNPMFEDEQGNPLSEEEIAAKISSMITANPNTWTKDNVTLTFTPISTNGFARNPYSWDGGVNWLNSQNYTTSKNGDYTLLVKDMYGNVYHSNIVSVNNIDKVAPTLDLEQQGNNLIITSTDAQSGVARIAWVGGTITSATTLKEYSGNQQTVNCVAELPNNGTYTVYVYDEAGNMNSVNKTVSGVTVNTNNNTSNTSNTSNSGNSGNTVEKYYYNTTVEKTTPVYVDKYVGGSSGSYTQPSYTYPQQTAYTTPVPTTATRTTSVTTPTPTPSPTPTATPTKTGSSAKTTTTSSTVTTASSKPSSTAKKVTTEVVAASPVKTSDTEEVEVLDKENAAKYRNSRVAGSVNATNDSKNGKGINIVLGIVGSLIALSGIAAGVYWYTAKYKPALIDGELSKDDYAFAEDIAMAQSDEEDGVNT